MARNRWQGRNIAGIVLAAGAARRFGADKLLAPVGRSATPMVLVSAGKLRLVTPAIHVVTAPDHYELQQLLLAHRLTPVPCADAKLGLGHSLACGVRHTALADAWIIALADQPFIAPEVYQELLGQFRRHGGIVRPCYQGQPGHPVLFEAGYYEELISCHGDRGARWIMQRHRHRLTLVNVQDPGAVRDVDLPGDLPPAV